jgi:small nuclear ribonucleoprotein (snRNP)-like protein
MPNHEEHCEHSLKRYGIRGDEIHAWMDEPSGVAGASHRSFRHDLSSLPTAIQLFGKLYGAETVENIFLDHLKADSEEARKHEVETEGSLSPKWWSQSDDEFLYQNFLTLSDDELEARFQTKSKTEIRKRREYLGLIRPKMLRRSRREQRVQRLVVNLKRGQKIYGTINVSGGNNDINFGIYTYQGRPASGLRPLQQERIVGSKSLEYTARVTGNLCFYFSNSFSFFTSKQIEFSYQLENGKKIKMSFSI